MAEDAYYFLVRRILITTFVLNIAVALAKTTYGFLTQSLSMTTDGLHSFFDSTSNIIGIIGIYLASKPADREHPYGHSKFETFAAIGIAILLFVTCFQVLEAAINRFMNPIAPDITSMSFIIMGATLAINVGVSAYEYIIGKRLGSSILIADSMHTRSDIYASIAVIVGFIAVKMGYPLADPLIAILVTGLISLTGLEIIKESSGVLLDKALLEESVVKRIVESVPGVCDCHRIRTRGAKGEMFIDLHIGLDPNLTVEQAHDVGTAVEGRIKDSISGVKDVVVHMEPKAHCELRSGR
ncbi:MAG: cation diffusion facilitator family transporter [Methanotrichaceae archaeon]|nr:cation diffusion facilitator family transporter [Methanotrichaceae archaeon]